jgi:hypothetical protein
MIKLINLKKLGNNDFGFLSFFESNKDISFEIKRIYYIYNVDLGSKRGMHAHKNLTQVLWCPFGIIEVILDNGLIKEKITLNSPEKILIVSKGYWRDMIWKKKNSVLCVAASDYYDENDYIRNYDEFLKLVEEGYWENESKI